MNLIFMTTSANKKIYKNICKCANSENLKGKALETVLPEGVLQA